MMLLRIFVALAATLVLGCQTMTTNDDRAARIINPDNTSRAALRAVVTELLNANITISDTALTNGDLLTIENNPPRTMDNPNPQGRILEMPIQFRLVINGVDCVLVDQRDQTRHLLTSTSCAPLIDD